MFDNQIDIRPPNAAINIQPQQAPPIIQMQQQQQAFEPPQEVVQRLNEFRSQQSHMQTFMRQSYEQHQSGGITSDQFETIKQEMQTKQSAMMLEMQEFQVKYEPILMRMSQMEQYRQNGQHGGHQHNQGGAHSHNQGGAHSQNQEGGHSHNGRQCNHDHGAGGGGGHAHQKKSMNPFANVPPNMKVFVLHQLVSGEYSQSIFQKLPMMPPLLQLYGTVKDYALYPLFVLNGEINILLEKCHVQLIKGIVGGLGIYYLMVHVTIYNFVVLPRLTQLVESALMKSLIIYDFYFMMVLALLAIVVDPGDLTTPYHKPAFQELIQARPELQVNHRALCPLCQIPKIIRSQHCMYTGKLSHKYNNRCIARYENHSMMLNTGVGAYNAPLYTGLLVSITVYFMMAVWAFTMDTVERQPKSLVQLFILLINLHQLYSFGQSTLVTMLKISYNISQVELKNWRRYTYLWKNERGEFYNPFDKVVITIIQNKGFIKNWYAFYLPLLNRVTCRKYVNCDAGVVDWGQAKFLNVADVKGHPMAARIAEEIAKQSQRQQHQHDHQQEYQMRPQQQQAKMEENQGLLSGDNA